jgi:hypothetical protein
LASEPESHFLGLSISYIASRTVAVGVACKKFDE